MKKSFRLPCFKKLPKKQEDKTKIKKLEKYLINQQPEINQNESKQKKAFFMKLNHLSQ